MRLMKNGQADLFSLPSRWTRQSLARFARDTAIVLGVSFGLLIVLELLLRLFAPQSLTGRSVRGEHFSATDPLLGMRYIPEAVWRFRHPEYRVEYAINTDGFRDAKARSERKPPGVTRVLLLGDSFTFGQGVDYEQAWPVLAEQELERQGLKVDLVKAGMQGADTRSELILLRRLVKSYDADAVVVGFLINDLFTNVPYTPASGSEAPEPELAAVQRTVFRRDDQARTFHLLTLAQRIASASDVAYIAMYLAAPGRGEYLRVPLPEVPRRQLEITEMLVRQMAAYCDSLGKPLIVFSMPQQFQVIYARTGRSDPQIDVSYYDRHFTQLAEAIGFEWVPTLEAFVEAEKTSGQDMFHRLDGHFTPAGNEVAAEVFMEKVLPTIRAKHRGGKETHSVTNGRPQFTKPLQP
jgi:lysophospholipase L1-like esterase